MAAKEEKPLKPAEKQRKHSSSFKIKVAARRRRVIELRMLGYKIPDIKSKLAEEGQNWSEDTIKNDLASSDASDFLQELKRQQAADIALCDDRQVRLEYRDREIDRLSPRRSPEVALSVNQQTTVSQPNSSLEEYFNAISQAAEVNQNIPAICTGEQLDSKETSPVDGQKRSDSKADAVSLSS